MRSIQFSSPFFFFLFCVLTYRPYEFIIYDDGTFLNSNFGFNISRRLISKESCEKDFPSFFKFLCWDEAWLHYIYDRRIGSSTCFNIKLSHQHDSQSLAMAYGINGFALIPHDPPDGSS